MLWVTGALIANGGMFLILFGYDPLIFSTGAFRLTFSILSLTTVTLYALLGYVFSILVYHNFKHHIYKLSIAFIVMFSILLTAVTPSRKSDDSGMHPLTKKPSYKGSLKKKQSGLPNILLITVDTLRADHLDCYDFMDIDTHFMDELSRSGATFTNCVSQISYTAPAVTSILTSLYPYSHGVLNNGDKAPEQLIFISEILKKYNYSTAAFVDAYFLNNICNFGQGFDFMVYWLGVERYLKRKLSLHPLTPYIPKLVKRSLREYMTNIRSWVKDDLIKYWLNNYASSPFFIWLHLMEVHDPFNPPAKYIERYSPGYTGKIYYTLDALSKVTPTEAEAQHTKARYAAGVHFTDDLLRQCYEQIIKVTSAENLMVILTADHGEILNEDKRGFGHSDYIFHKVFHIPLIMVYPKVIPAGVRIDALAQQIDISPTLADMLKIETGGMQGKSLLPLLEQKAGKVNDYAYCVDFLRQRCIYGEKFKAVDFNDEKLPYGLFDYRKDAEELDNLVSAQVDDFNDLIERMRKFFDELPRGEIHKDDFSAEMIEELKALGYLR